VRGLNRRVLRLEFVAGLGIAMALAVLPAAAAAQQITTHTVLTVQTTEQGGLTQATANVTVAGADGLPASGIVLIADGDRELAEATLNSAGEATPAFSLAGGDHALHAVYVGDASHLGSASATSDVTAEVSSTPSFTLTLTPVAPSTLPLSLTAGQAGTIAVNVIPEDNAALTAPMFVTLSCSGLPSEASCTFTPESVEILATTPATCSSNSPPSACPPVSSMLLQTSEHVTTRLVRPSHSGNESGPVAWAILLPGALGLGGLAWSARRRRWLQRLTLLALVGLVTALGTTACKPLYNYYQLGPPHPPATPNGTYTVTVTAQSTNGVTATTYNTTMVLTVTGGS
jgi:Bacterial Ig-like domain (group 3)